MTKIRSHRTDWFDRVAIWRGRKSSTARQAIGQAGHTRYYFMGKRFCHCITADTLSQMEYVPADHITHHVWNVT
jgi:hypothetical protein